MAVTGAISIVGMDGLLASLRGLAGDKIAKAALRKALRAAAKPIQKQGVANAPVRQEPYPAGTKNRSPGTLRKNIKVRAMRRSRKGIGIMVSSSGQKNVFAGDAYYGGFLEYGTATISPRPFMRPAFDSKKDVAKLSAIEVMQTEIEKVSLNK
jgi:HK97 gp10 family phage protein